MINAAIISFFFFFILQVIWYLFHLLPLQSSGDKTVLSACPDFIAFVSFFG